MGATSTPPARLTNAASLQRAAGRNSTSVERCVDPAEAPGATAHGAEGRERDEDGEPHP